MSDIGLKQLDVGQRVKIKSKIYKIDSYIVYEDEENSRFIEYELKAETNKKDILWICVGINYEETLFFKEAKYADGEKSLINKGYELIEDLEARTINSCNADNDPYEKVHFKEFRNKDTKQIFSIETWEDEICYSESMDMNVEDIDILIDTSTQNKTSESSDKKTSIPYLKYILLLLIPIGLLFGSSYLNKKKFIETYLKEDSSYEYFTSITSDVDSKLKADVYKTELSMETATEFIVGAASQLIQDVQSSEDEYSIGILTKYEYAIVYIGMDDKTYIQISPREYIYVGGDDLYHAYYPSSNMYYRDFYYSFGYEKDKSKYKKRVSPYVAYAGNTVAKNSSDKYRVLKSSGPSIKQSSVYSRSSSGGGLSSGK